MVRLAAAFAATATVAFAVPNAVQAVTDANVLAVQRPAGFAPFTPASVDPALAQRVAAALQARGLDLRFTPASSTSNRDQTVTVAVRVNDRTAQAISVRTATAIAQTNARPGLASVGRASVAIAPTRYNLGIARGYQGFAKTPGLAATTLPAGIKPVDMPDLADFKPSTGAADKPSRFKTRIALEKEQPLGRSPQTREALGDQSFDLGGAYRVTRNLDVTAGVRLSQDRDRLDPVTDSVQDSQAVYVGTQFRF